MNKQNLNIAAGILCIATGVLFVTGFTEERNTGTSVGQESLSSLSGVMAIPVQLGRDTYGLAMIDTQAQTLWIYEFNARGQLFDQLRLITARSFAYDRQLTEWNTAAPTPTQVRQMVESMQ